MEHPITEVDLLARNWRAILLKGLVALLLGVSAVLMPRLSLAALLFAYGVYAVADGLFGILAAFQRRRGVESPRWAYFWMGLIDIAAGLVALFWPHVTVLVVLYLVAAKSLVDGIFQIVAAIRLRRQLRGEWLFILSGFASIAFAALLVVFPAASALALVLWVGVFALIYGATLVAVALRLHSWEKRHSLHGEAALSRPAPSSSG